MRTLVLGIFKGRFRLHVSDRKPELTCALKADALAKMFKRANYDPFKPDDKQADIMMSSSSIDFPESDGAPKRFNAHKVIREAMVLMLPVELRAKARAKLKEEGAREEAAIAKIQAKVRAFKKRRRAS